MPAYNNTHARELFITVHCGVIRFSKPFAERYLKSSRFSSVSWHEESKILSLELYQDDSLVARRYRITVDPNGSYLISCAAVLKLVDKHAGHERFNIDNIKVDVSKQGNIVFNLSFGE